MNASHETRPESWTQLRIDRRSPSYWGATFDHPPINTAWAEAKARPGTLATRGRRPADQGSPLARREGESSSLDGALHEPLKS
jgi:hypothetical protein